MFSLTTLKPDKVTVPLYNWCSNTDVLGNSRNQGKELVHAWRTVWQMNYVCCDINSFMFVNWHKCTVHWFLCFFITIQKCTYWYTMNQCNVQKVSGDIMNHFHCNQGYRLNWLMLPEISQLEGGKCIQKWTLKLYQTISKFHHKQQSNGLETNLL